MATVAYRSGPRSCSTSGRGASRWTCEAVDAGMRFTIRNDFEGGAPVGIFGKLASPLVERVLQCYTATSAANLKRLLET